MNFFSDYWYFITLVLILIIIITLEIRYYFLIKIKIKTYKKISAAKWNDNQITLSDGYNINYFHNYEPNMKTIIIGVHGLGTSKEDFTLAAKYFATKNISLFSFDQRGFGDNKKWQYKNLGTTINDINEIISLIKKKYSQSKIILFGESLGAALSAWLSNYGKSIDGIILSNFVTNFQPPKFEKKLIVQFLKGFFINAKKPLKFNFDPNLISSNKEYIKLTKKRFEDQKTISMKMLLQTRYLSIKIVKMIQANDKIPFLIIQSKADIFANLNKVTKIKNNLKDKNLTFELLSQGKHALLNEPNNEQLFELCTQWITMKIETKGDQNDF